MSEPIVLTQEILEEVCRQKGHSFSDTGNGITTIETSWHQECHICGASRWKKERHPWEYGEIKPRRSSAEGE